jgi:hypothetical protein
MLDLNNFTGPDAYGTGVSYYGMNHYHITQDRTGYAVQVEMLDEDGNATPGETYAASSMSIAMAIIERLEAGEAE